MPEVSRTASRFGRRLAWVWLGMVCMLLIGCAGTAPNDLSSSPPASARTSAPAPAGARSIVALGDSVPAGTACQCTPYPELSAADLSAPGSRAVTIHNEAVPGFRTLDVLRQLSGAGAAVGHVKQAGLVELQVGANDVAHSEVCGSRVDCYLPKVAEVKTNLQAIVRRIRELAAGHAALVVLLDYWSVWLGGQYAQQQGRAYVDAAATVTEAVDTAIREVARETGSAFVDLRAAFKGPDYSYDETHYLAPDGDHPNASGHRQIAAAVAEVAQRRGVHPS